MPTFQELLKQSKLFITTETAGQIPVGKQTNDSEYKERNYGKGGEQTN